MVCAAIWQLASTSKCYGQAVNKTNIDWDVIGSRGVDFAWCNGTGVDAAVGMVILG